MHQVRVRKMNTSESPFTRRNMLVGIETGVAKLLQDKLGGSLIYWPSGTRRKGDISLTWALLLNCGNLDKQC